MNFQKILIEGVAAGVAGFILGVITYKILDDDDVKDVKWFFDYIKNYNKDVKGDRFLDAHNKPCIRTCGCTCACNNDVECKCFCLVCNEVRRMRDFYKHSDEVWKNCKQR